ncbi:MAG TPA: hypothetical protein VGE47_04815 [Burkholderiaceae bacterium]
MKRQSRILAGGLLAMASAAHARFCDLAGRPMLAVTSLSYDGWRAVGVNGDNTPACKRTATTGVQAGIGDVIGGQAEISWDGNTVACNAISPAN